MAHAITAGGKHLRERDIPDDCRQDVIEVMGDPAGQHPYRFELLGL